MGKTMVDDLSDVHAELRRMQEQIRVLNTTNPLESASVNAGRLRFIGGLLRIDSGGRLEVVGTLAIDGTTTVTGNFTVTGPWRLEGAGTITGNVNVTGNITSTGTLTQNGAWNMNGPGNIAGNVTQTGNTTMTGNFTIGAGGKITVGGMVIDPSGGGKVTFPGGAEVKGGSGGGVEVTQGAYRAIINGTGASVGKTGLALAITDAVGFQLVGVPATSGKGVPNGTLWADTTGRIYRATS